MKSNQLLLIITLTLTALTGFSCAKKSSKVRAIKTEARVMNVQTTTNSVNIAQTQDLDYKLYSISEPELNGDGSNTVSSEVKSLSQYLPFSTTHLGTQDAYGIYEDQSQGTKLDIRSRCVGEACEKYVILVTVVKNGYAYHQMAAISFSTDAFFYFEERNHKVAQMYKSLDEVLAQHAGLQSGQ